MSKSEDRVPSPHTSLNDDIGEEKRLAMYRTQVEIREAEQRAILGLKDANFALAAAEAVGVSLPSGNVWRDRLVGAIAHGEGDHDWAIMARD
jgi:3-hydroxyisobutyrate dehydrogenase-like beta-hydroxyacid dehydrogenase